MTAYLTRFVAILFAVVLGGGAVSAQAQVFSVPDDGSVMGPNNIGGTGPKTITTVIDPTSPDNSIRVIVWEWDADFEEFMPTGFVDITRENHPTISCPVDGYVTIVDTPDGDSNGATGTCTKS